MATRAEHRRQTLLTLGGAALELFSELGSKATIDQIATRAGVSRRTIFRWVDSKEQLAFVHPMLWFDVFDEALASVIEADMPLTEKLRYASLAIAEHIDSAPDGPRDAFMVVIEHPFLVRGFYDVQGKWVDRIAEVVLAADPAPDTQTIFRSRVIGAAVMGMVDASMREWLLSPGSSFVDIYSRGFALLVPLFADIE